MTNPSPAPWSEAELRQMADAAYVNAAAYCPVCRSRIEVDGILMTGGTTRLRFWCERCHVKGYFHDECLIAMELEWTAEEIANIEDAFWQRGGANCTVDGAVLRIHKGYEAMTRELLVRGTCPRCGRNFRRTKSESETARGVGMSPFKQSYEFIRTLAAGGMGEVSLVRERSTGRELAAKTIKPEYLRDPDAIRRFQREKRILASLVHPNIVTLYDAQMDEHGGVFVMEYMPRGDLSAVINDKAVTATALAGFFDGIAAGLKYTHQQGIIHRDLKPGNVLIDDEGNARVSDFGLAVLTNRDTTPLTVGGLGTRHYAAPEQMTDAANVDHRVDIFALGLIAYEVATRESPWAPPVVSTGDEAFDAVLKRSIHRDRERRTATTDELAAALRSCLNPTCACQSPISRKIRTGEGHRQV